MKTITVELTISPMLRSRERNNLNRATTMPEGVSVEFLLQQFGFNKEHVLVIVNNEIAGEDRILHQDDRVAVLPCLAGG